MNTQSRWVAWIMTSIKGPTQSWGLPLESSGMTTAIKWKRRCVYTHKRTDTCTYRHTRAYRHTHWHQHKHTHTLTQTPTQKHTHTKTHIRIHTLQMHINDEYVKSTFSDNCTRIARISNVSYCTLIFRGVKAVNPVIPRVWGGSSQGGMDLQQGGCGLRVKKKMEREQLNTGQFKSIKFMSVLLQHTSIPVLIEYGQGLPFSLYVRRDS